MVPNEIETARFQKKSMVQSEEILSDDEEQDDEEQLNEVDGDEQGDEEVKSNTMEGDEKKEDGVNKNENNQDGNGTSQLLDNTDEDSDDELAMEVFNKLKKNWKRKEEERIKKNEAIGYFGSNKNEYKELLDEALAFDVGRLKYPHIIHDERTPQKGTTFCFGHTLDMMVRNITDDIDDSGDEGDERDKSCDEYDFNVGKC